MNFYKDFSQVFVYQGCLADHGFWSGQNKYGLRESNRSYLKYHNYDITPKTYYPILPAIDLILILSVVFIYLAAESSKLLLA